MGVKISSERSRTIKYVLAQRVVETQWDKECRTDDDGMYVMGTTRQYGVMMMMMMMMMMEEGEQMKKLGRVNVNGKTIILAPAASESSWTGDSCNLGLAGLAN